MTTDDEKPIEHYTQEEVRSILNSLSNEELKAIRLCAHYICKMHSEIEDYDLVNDVVCSVLNENKPRKWPRNLSPKIFFNNSMLSLASNREKKSLKSHGVITDTVITPENGESYVENIGHADCIPESIDASNKLEKIQNHFSSDPEVQAFIIGRMQGFTEREIKSQFNMTQNKYESARKRLARGWSKINFEE